MAKARDYKEEYARYQGKPEQIKNRAQRNAARAEMMKAGKAHKGDGKDVGHKRAIDNGGTNAAGNLAIQSVASNRGYKRDKKNNPI